MVYGYKCVHCSLFCLRSVFVNTFIILLLFPPLYDVIVVLHYCTKRLSSTIYIYISYIAVSTAEAVKFHVHELPKNI